MNTRDLEYDVLIIGSGAGGGTVASELSALCARGLRVGLLEAGGSFRAIDNTRQELAMAGKYYVESGAVQNVDGDMTFAFARALGGSTTVYTGTSLTMPESAIQAWELPGLTAEDLHPRYEKYIQQNNVQLISRSSLSESNLRFERACHSLGWNVEQFPVNVRGCEGLASCNFGCPKLAKQGTHVVQIPSARSRGVDVFPFTEVIQVDGHTVRARAHPPKFGLEPGPLPPGDYEFRAAKVAFCGGAVGNPLLLGRSPGFSELPALGRYFMCHPAMILAGRHNEDIRPTMGHPKSFYSDQFLDRERFLLETCLYYPFTLAKSLSGIGDELDPFLQPFGNLQLVLALAIDDPHEENRIEADPDGSAKIHYSLNSAVMRSLTNAQRAAAEILFESGAEGVHIPASKKQTLYRSDRARIKDLVREEYFLKGKVTVSAAHLMGTCRMGDDPKTSVTDSFGRIHGWPDHYVADASLFPKSSEVNPYLTVMALADRVAEAIRRDLGDI